MKLIGNVIKETGVAEEESCQLECVKDSKCLSYNFNATTNEKTLNCQLSDSDRFQSLKNFTKDDEYVYRGIQSLCEEDDSYCGDNEVCIPDYQNDSVLCKCVDGYFGKPCASYVALGCFRKGVPPAFPDLVKNLRGNIDWNDMTKTVNACAQLVHSRGLTTFGIYFYGECRSGVDSGNTYDRHGLSQDCWNGVGKSKTNFVYKIVS
ncbi:uncharacterized protein [Montipora capricornis]